MFHHSATDFDNRFKQEWIKDFKKSFPELSSLTIKVSNDPHAKESSWGDCIKIHGHLLGDNLFGVHVGRQMDFNCGIAVISSLTVISYHTKKGIGRWVCQQVAKMLLKQGYTVAIGTNNRSQEDGGACEFLRKSGWHEIEDMRFTNRRSLSAIKFWLMKL